MTTTNVPLQKRAGRNIGIEPGSSPFVQDGGGRETNVPATLGAKTVILSCPDRMARSPQTGGIGSGFVVNGTASDYTFKVFFRDDQGNEAQISNAQTVPTGDVLDFIYGVETGAINLVLCPGEKIILLGVANPEPP